MARTGQGGKRLRPEGLEAAAREAAGEATATAPSGHASAHAAHAALRVEHVEDVRLAHAAAAVRVRVAAVAVDLLHVLPLVVALLLLWVREDLERLAHLVRVRGRVRVRVRVRGVGE